MKAFADWVSGRPIRVWLLAVLTLQLMPPLAPALLALNALRRGPTEGMLGVAITLGVTLAIVNLSGASASQLAFLIGMSLMLLLPAAAGGAMLAWSRNFSLAYQGTVIGTMVVVFLVFATYSPAAGLGAILEETWAQLAELGFAAEQLEVLASLPPEAYISLLLFGFFAVSMSALLLGFWWFTLIRDDISFGSEFRELRLGLFASIVLMVAVTLGQLVPYAPLQYLGELALVGFLFPGLAVMHARARSDNWPVGVLILVYVLLCFPLTTMVIVLGLSAVGLIDNFFALRKRAGPGD